MPAPALYVWPPKPWWLPAPLWRWLIRWVEWTEKQ